MKRRAFLAGLFGIPIVKLDPAKPPAVTIQIDSCPGMLKRDKDGPYNVGDIWKEPHGTRIWVFSQFGTNHFGFRRIR